MKPDIWPSQADRNVRLSEQTPSVPPGSPPPGKASASALHTTQLVSGVPLPRPLVRYGAPDAQHRYAFGYPNSMKTASDARRGAATGRQAYGKPNSASYGVRSIRRTSAAPVDERIGHPSSSFPAARQHTSMDSPPRSCAHPKLWIHGDERQMAKSAAVSVNNLRYCRACIAKILARNRLGVDVRRRCRALDASETTQS
jgi:hypothetical protein